MDVLVYWLPLNFGYEGNLEGGLDACCIRHGDQQYYCDGVW